MLAFEPNMPQLAVGLAFAGQFVQLLDEGVVARGDGGGEILGYQDAISSGQKCLANGRARPR